MTSKHERHIRDARAVASRLPPYECDVILRMCRSSKTSMQENRMVNKEYRKALTENERLREALKKYTCACSPLQVCSQKERDFPDCGWTARTALKQNRSD